MMSPSSRSYTYNCKQVIVLNHFLTNMLAVKPLFDLAHVTSPNRPGIQSCEFILMRQLLHCERQCGELLNDVVEL